jgi:hypothetical protein
MPTPTKNELPPQFLAQRAADEARDQGVNAAAVLLASQQPITRAEELPTIAGAIQAERQAEREADRRRP